jgi:hypothetical protein
MTLRATLAREYSRLRQRRRQQLSFLLREAKALVPLVGIDVRNARTLSAQIVMYSYTMSFIAVQDAANEGRTLYFTRQLCCLLKKNDVDTLDINKMNIFDITFYNRKTVAALTNSAVVDAVASDFLCVK